ncbi:MAG TPA: ABC transporter substrate-binding protein, partial [Paraburkholderia sp.]|nr:ABC transporter substrate-binding protein [Paraburkholderia sp.]
MRVVQRLSRIAVSGRSFLARTASAAAFAGVALVSFAAPSAHAEDHVTLLTSWYAQAEHGGFYQAVATGIYKKYGLDVTIKMGGPQVNGMQLLAGGQTDFLLGYDFQVLSSVEAGIPVTTVAAAFQYDPQGMMTHADVTSLAGLKSKTILVAGSGRTTWWPWLKAKYGYTEAQARPYTFNLQPFFADPNVAMQAYPSSETYQAEQAHANAHFFLFADDGYPP